MVGVIPALLFRVVPEKTDDIVEARWAKASTLHPHWQLTTYRDPLDPVKWPATAEAWPACTSGAQFAGLVRLEALVRHGGVYIDSDYDALRPFDPLLGVRAFAGWEDRRTLPDAVLGAEPDHPAMRHALDLAVRRVHAARGAWQSGPGATTDALGNAPDVLRLPPGAFYPYHYTEKHRASENYAADPWCFGVHRWAASWLG